MRSYLFLKRRDYAEARVELAALLSRVAQGVQLVDSAEAVAEQVAAEMSRSDPTASSRRSPEHHFCVTDDSERFARIARMVLGQANLSLELVEVL